MSSADSCHVVSGSHVVFVWQTMGDCVCISIFDSDVEETRFCGTAGTILLAGGRVLVHHEAYGNSSAYQESD